MDGAQTHTRSIAQPPTPADSLRDRLFRGFLRATAWFAAAVAAAVVALIGWQALPALRQLGLGFLVSSTWDPGKEQYGVLPEIFGTLLSSSIAVLLGGVFGVAAAIFLTQEFIPRRLQSIFKTIINLLATIPSVVYGLWG